MPVARSRVFFSGNHQKNSCEMARRRRSATDIARLSRVPRLTERIPSRRVATRLSNLVAEHGPVVQPESVGVHNRVGEARADPLGPPITAVAHGPPGWVSDAAH
jgi:hypothetical protein